MEHTDNNQAYDGENKPDDRVSQAGGQVSPPIVPSRVDEQNPIDPDAPTSYPSFLNEPSPTDATHLIQDDVLPPVLPPVLPAQSDYQPVDLNAKDKEETAAETEPKQETPVAWVNEPVSVSGEVVAAPIPPRAPIVPPMEPEPTTKTEPEAEQPKEPIAEQVMSPSDPTTGAMKTVFESSAETDKKTEKSETSQVMPAETDKTTVETTIAEPAPADIRAVKQTPVQGTPETETVSDAADEPQQNNDYKSATFLDDLFANGNECVTLPTGSFPVKDDTRALLVLFSNGRFFVAESAKFDGKVLGFEYLARKRRLQIGKPEYVPSIVINDIYEYANRNNAARPVAATVESEAQEQVRMQRDFVTIVSRAASSKVSDIHIVVADHTTVMFRINGLMQTEMEYNKEWGESFVRAAFASADISDANYAQNEYQAAQKLGRTPLRGSGGRLVLPRNVLGIRLQFNPIAFGSRYVVMRLLYAEDDVSAAADLGLLGFSKKETDLFYQMRAFPTGIVVVSGPTGSGKSTTLQRNMIAMLQERNYETNLITVEDPPEYPIPGARQMPVTNAMIEEAKEREFTKALSAALRSDPDSLMIGEIRTLSAADLAFRGALSGHNVWTTLHANNAPAILMRLKDIGVEDFKLQDPSIMKGMMAQRLFRKLCPSCRIKATENLKHPAVERLRKAFGDDVLEQCYLRGPGCKECDFRGVNGRTVVAEFILPDATFLDLSVRGESKKALNYWINDLNGITLRESALERMLSGVIDVEEVERWTGFLDQYVMA